MKLQLVLIGLGLLHSAASFTTIEPPGCVSNCWDNSKYVSTCTKGNETLCLCKDAHFQNVVLQCLYSQCQTTQFGSALHHALAACSVSDEDVLGVLPPLIRHQGVRKRGSPTTGIASGHVSASAVHSVARRSVSASALHQSSSARATRTIGHLPTSTHGVPASSLATLLAPLSDGGADSSTALGSTKTS